MKNITSEKKFIFFFQNEGQNSKHIVKYRFQVALKDEDDDEDTLFMDSWIYLDLESDEELFFVTKHHLAEENGYDEVTNVAEKLEDKLKLPPAGFFTTVSSPNVSQTLLHSPSAEDNQLEHYSSQTLPNSQDSDGLKSINTLTTFREYNSEKDNTAEITSPDVSKVYPTESPPKCLCNGIETSEQSMDVYSSELENTAETQDNGVAKSIHTISKSSLSVSVMTIDLDETNTHSADVTGLKVKSFCEMPDIHTSKSILREVTDSVMNHSEKYRYSTDNYEVQVENTSKIPYIHVSENTIETPHTHGFKSKAVEFNVDPCIKTKTNSQAEKPVSFRNQKKKNSVDEVVTIISDDEEVTISDDEPVTIISDGEDSEIKSEILFIGSYQSSSGCGASKNKTKDKSEKTQQSTHAIATNNNNDGDIIVCEEETVSEVIELPFRPRKAKRGSEKPNSYVSDEILEETIYPVFDSEVNVTSEIVGYRRKRKKKESSSSSDRDINSAISFLPDRRNKHVCKSYDGS